MYFSVYCSWHFIYYINSKKNISFVLVFQKKIKIKKIKSKIEHFFDSGFGMRWEKCKVIGNLFICIIYYLIICFFNLFCKFCLGFPTLWSNNDIFQVKSGELEKVLVFQSNGMESYYSILSNSYTKTSKCFV